MPTEFLHDDHILMLDGRVLDIFHRGMREPMRFHVAFMGVYVKPRGDVYKVQVGTLVGKDVMGGVHLNMDASTFERFRQFIALATAARDGAPNP
ncbi:hypothetical protein [Dactylosporangium darangshiense]